MLGGIDSMVQVLALFVIFDWLTGVLAALKDGRFNYRIGLWGIITKLVMFIIVCIAVQVDILITSQVMDFPLVRTAVLLPLIGNEGLSCLDNIDRLGVKIPEPLRTALQKARGD